MGYPPGFITSPKMVDSGALRLFKVGARSIHAGDLRLDGHQKQVVIPDRQSFKDPEAFLFVYFYIARVGRLKK